MTADLLAVTPEIIQRYNRPGPRYTSYPTVPVWSISPRIMQPVCKKKG